MVINLERVSLKGSDGDLSAKECRNEGFAKIDLQISLRDRNFLQIDNEDQVPSRLKEIKPHAAREAPTRGFLHFGTICNVRCRPARSFHEARKSGLRALLGCRSLNGK